MQHTKAKQLREIWGSKPCDHPDFEKEYYLSSDTGDFICTKCGKEFTKDKKEEIEQSRTK